MSNLRQPPSEANYEDELTITLTRDERDLIITALEDLDFNEDENELRYNLSRPERPNPDLTFLHGLRDYTLNRISFRPDFEDENG